jgi:hypothetical protein
MACFVMLHNVAEKTYCKNKINGNTHAQAHVTSVDWHDSLAVVRVCCMRMPYGRLGTC